MHFCRITVLRRQVLVPFKALFVSSLQYFAPFFPSVRHSLDRGTPVRLSLYLTTRSLSSPLLCLRPQSHCTMPQFVLPQLFLFLVRWSFYKIGNIRFKTSQGKNNKCYKQKYDFHTYHKCCQLFVSKNVLFHFCSNANFLLSKMINLIIDCEIV